MYFCFILLYGIFTLKYFYDNCSEYLFRIIVWNIYLQVYLG